MKTKSILVLVIVFVFALALVCTFGCATRSGLDGIEAELNMQPMPKTDILSPKDIYNVNLRTLDPKAAARDSEVKSLYGLRGVQASVIINPMAKAYSPSEEHLMTLIKLRLRREGIEIVELFENQPETPILFIAISAFAQQYESGEETGSAAYLAQFILSQEVRLRRTHPSITVPLWAVTWHRTYYGVEPINTTSDAIERNVSEFLDEFINDWHKANPKENGGNS